LKSPETFIYSKFGAKTFEYFIGKLIDFGAENVHPGTRLSYPVSVLLLQKQFLQASESTNWFEISYLRRRGAKTCIKPDLIVLKCHEKVVFKGHILRWCENFTFPVGQHGDFDYHADFCFSWAENVN
jgi:hypothetical protein